MTWILWVADYRFER